VQRAHDGYFDNTIPRIEKALGLPPGQTLYSLKHLSATVNWRVVDSGTLGTLAGHAKGSKMMDKHYRTRVSEVGRAAAKRMDALAQVSTAKSAAEKGRTSALHG